MVKFKENDRDERYKITSNNSNDKECTKATYIQYNDTIQRIHYMYLCIILEEEEEKSNA